MKHLTLVLAAMIATVLVVVPRSSADVELPYVDSLVVSAADGSHPICPDDSIAVKVNGHFPNDCFRFRRIELLPGSAGEPPIVRIVVDDMACLGRPCLQVLVPWKARVVMPPLPARLYGLQVRLAVTTCSDVVDPERETISGAAFEVACNPTGPLPYVDRIDLSSATGGAICPSDSIRVQFTGVFPSPCYQFKRFDLLPSPIMAPGPQPPIVRAVVEVSCVACPAVLEPWSASVLLPPLPTGRYNLITQMDVSGPCIDPPPTPPTALVPFQVIEAESCSTIGRCFIPGWVHPNGPFGCDAVIGWNAPPRVTFAVRSGVALAGLQGRFSVSPPGLSIFGIEAVGPASDMNLSWSAAPGGARFVLFAKSGAPIPASSAGQPILRLTLGSIATVIPPPETFVAANDLFGSDSNGHAVDPCHIRSDRFAADLARICLANDCDFNTDGRTDIRDLVLMARCLRNVPACPDSVTDRLDCNHDGHFSLDDVLCCARRILGSPPCPGCPADTTRPGDGIAVAFGTPRRTTDGVDIPVRIVGSLMLGGARLEFLYPGSRFSAASVVVSPGQEWLDVVESQSGLLTLGLVRLQELVFIRDPGPLELTLRLTLGAGQDPGGEVRVADHEFSGVDGVLLEVDVDAATSLGVSSGLSLSEAWPNPFESETRFSVSQPRSGRLAVTVHDVSGRTIATLANGVREGGVHTFVWNGRVDRGGTAGNGIFFVRVRSGSESASLKLIRMRGR